MNEREARERVRAVVAALAPLRSDEVERASLLVLDLGFDSLGLWELVATLEREFGLIAELEESDEVDVETVGDVEERVLDLLVKQRGLEGNVRETAD